MEKWKKLINHTIELLDRHHGEQVQNFYKGIGVTIGTTITFNRNRSEGDKRRYYMVCEDGTYDYWSYEESLCRNLKIITLEEAKRIVENDTESFNVPLTKIVGRVVI